MADPSTDLIQSLMQFARPADIPQIRRSKYLADALQSLASTGAEQSRTPVALASNLLAEALLKHGSDKTFQKLYGSLAGGMQNYADTMGSGLPGWQSAAPDHAAAPPPAASPGAPMDVSPPAASPGAAMAAPPTASSAPSAAPAQPSQGGGIPTQPVNPQAVAMAQQLIKTGQPALVQRGMAMLQQLREQSMKYVALPPGDAYRQDGSVQNLAEQWDYQPGPKPGTQIGTNRSTGEQKMFDSGVTGSAPEGLAFGAHGASLSAMPVTVGAHTMDRNYSPDALTSMQDQVLKSEEYKYASESAKAFHSMVANSKLPGGISGYGMVDTYVRTINPGAVARQGSVDAVLASRGVPQEVLGILQNLRGGGPLTAEIRDQLIKSAAPFAHANYESVQRLNNSRAEFAKRHGLDPLDVTADIGDDPTASSAPAAPGGKAPASAPPGTAVNPFHLTTPDQVKQLPKGSFWIGPSGRVKGPT